MGFRGENAPAESDTGFPHKPVCHNGERCRNWQLLNTIAIPVVAQYDLCLDVGDTAWPTDVAAQKRRVKCAL